MYYGLWLNCERAWLRRFADAVDALELANTGAELNADWYDSRELDPHVGAARADDATFRRLAALAFSRRR